MASPYDTTTNSFRASAEASGDAPSDSGIGDTKLLLPHGGEAAATGPPGFRVSQTVVVQDEQGGCENEVFPALESLTLSPAVQGDGPMSTTDETPPIFSIGNMVSPEEEVNAPGSAEMVRPEQEHSPQDMTTKLAKTIDHLQKQLRSGAEQKERMKQDKEKMKQDFEKERDQYEAVIASKNAEIEELKEKVKACKVQISNLERTNRDERVKYESQIEQLQKKVEIKEQEIDRIKEDFKSKRVKFENDKMQLKLEITECRLKISQMELRRST